MNKLLFLLLGLLIGSASATPLGTAFTYSGRLKYQNNPANGNFDLQVKLFDALNGGNQVGQTVNVNALSIVNGLFVTSLDFGGGPFNGTAYWLDIAARPSGNGQFTVLSPRQPVNPAPYALYAPKADVANTASAAAANSVSSSSLQNSSITSTKIASGQVVKSLNGLTDNVTLAAGANVSLTPNGNTLTIGSSAGSSSWSLAGNAGTTPGANFIGTSDSQPLEFKANGLRVLRLESILSISVAAAGNNSAKDLGGSSTLGVNVIGGFNGNRVADGVLGATIAGGGYTSTFNGITTERPNEVTAGYGSIGGGAGNSVGGLYGTVPGGSRNHADGPNSFAAGLDAHAQDNGSFVWGDGTFPTYSAGAHSFVVRASGGFNALTTFLQVSGAGNEQAYLGGDGSGGDVQLGSLNPAIVNVALYNAGNGTYMNLIGNTAYFAGDASCASLTIRGGADIAEPFPMSRANISKGCVVVIDDEHPGQLRLSTEPYDTHVAGIVSGANGINPGLSLRQEGALEGGQNVALTGRVYVLADASINSIKPGDLLTTSSTPGHAMKVTEHARAHGAILGKAMSGLKDGKGMVLVLVTLQ